ncbi:MAG: DNA-processing protein DprA [bacterium]|nr:DNA-processing protein DprA [bacterium]
MDNIVTKENSRYPKLLAEIGKDAPKQLYYKGEWNQDLFERCLAVVGARRMTSYGRRVTEQIVSEVAAAGITIVSGFMYGIDETAHRAALMVGGKTIAVMPCGIDIIHPEYQADLYEKILDKGGLVLSEYEGTHPVASWTFPRRNRIVAGISKAVLVVEAGETSGALITADLANKYGRKVFAVPGPITSSVSKGVTRLLREGAEAVGAARDILALYGAGFRTARKDSVPRHVAGELEQKIVELLEGEPMEIDVLARQLEVPASRLGASVSMLQLEGVLSEEQGKYYVC